MTLSSAVWHPAWYESLSVLAFCLYPLFVFPLFRRAELWRTSAPVLLLFLPLAHSLLLACLATRSMFLGMARTQVHRPGAAVAACLADVHGLLKIGACFSILVLLVAVAAARRNRPLPGIAKGRGLAFGVIAASLILIGAVFAMTYAMFAGTIDVRLRGLQLIHPALFASGALVIFTIGAAILLTRHSARGDLPVSGSHWPTLGVCLTIITIIATASWLAQNRLAHIAMSGFVVRGN